MSLLLQYSKCTSSSSYLNVLQDVFYVQYANIEVMLSVWRVKTLLKTVVFRNLVPHQMFHLYHEFGITDTTTWSGLSYNHAVSIL